MNRCQHLQLCHRSPWDHRQVWRCLRSMLVCVQSAFRLCPGTLLRWRRVRFLSIVVNPGELFEILVCDQAGVPSATCATRLTRRWPGNATGWFVEVQYVGCSDPSFGQLLAQMLPPTGTGVLHVSSSISSMCCTWVTWPDRDVVHSDTPSVVASAMLPAQLFTQQRGAPGTADTVDLFQAPSVAKAVPAPTMPHLHHLFLLKPLAYQMTRVLPVCWKKWLSWNNVCRPVALLVESRPIKLRSVLQANTVDGLGTLVGAGVAVTSAVTRPVVLTKEALLIWPRPVMAISFRSRVSVNLEIIKKFLAQRGGTDEGGSDELAAGVLQCLTSGFHGAHPQSSISHRSSRELRTSGMHRRLARR